MSIPGDLRAYAVAMTPYNTAMIPRVELYRAAARIDRLHAQRDYLVGATIILLALAVAGWTRPADRCAAPSASELVGDPETVQLETLRIGPEPLTAPGGNRYAL